MKTNSSRPSATRRVTRSPFSLSCLALLWVLAPPAFVTVGCRCGARSGPGAAARGDALPASSPPARDARAFGLLQLLFSVDEQSDPPTTLGCQLHLLDRQGSLVVAVDLGDGRRRTHYAKISSYRRRPALFPFRRPDGQLQLELHSTVAAPVVAPAALGRPGVHRVLPTPLPRSWAYACVLRQRGGGGAAIEGIVIGRRPKINGVRRLERYDAARLARRLKRLLTFAPR